MQAGALKALQEMYDLDEMHMTGASAGALCAVLAGCNVDMDRAFEVASRCVSSRSGSRLAVTASSPQIFCELYIHCTTSLAVRTGKTQDESTDRQRGRLAQDNGVWERPQGLMGIWGGMIRGWLDELLPADAADSCRGRVAVSVTAIRPAMPPLRVRAAGPHDSIPSAAGPRTVRFAG